MDSPNDKSTFSIVMAVHDQADELQRFMPQLLTQQLEAPYQVIVVDESSTDNTADVLKRLKADYSHLYTTFLPQYRFQQNRRRLSFTIGAKAANCQWVILTDVSTTPQNDHWLQELQEFATGSTTLMLGYVKRKTDDVRLQTYDDISQARSIITKAEQWRANIGHAGLMHAIRRSTHYDFIVVRADHAHELLRLFALDPCMKVKKER